MTNEEKALHFVLMEPLNGVLTINEKSCTWKKGRHKIAKCFCDEEGWFFVSLYDTNYKSIIKETLGEKCVDWISGKMLMLSANAYIDTCKRAMRALNMH